MKTMFLLRTNLYIYIIYISISPGFSLTTQPNCTENKKLYVLRSPLFFSSLSFFFFFRSLGKTKNKMYLNKCSKIEKIKKKTGFFFILRDLLTRIQLIQKTLYAYITWLGPSKSVIIQQKLIDDSKPAERLLKVEIELERHLPLWLFVYIDLRSVLTELSLLVTFQAQDDGLKD